MAATRMIEGPLTHELRDTTLQTQRGSKSQIRPEGVTLGAWQRWLRMIASRTLVIPEPQRHSSFLRPGLRSGTAPKGARVAGVSP